jgi:hypothetical protein
MMRVMSPRPPAVPRSPKVGPLLAVFALGLAACDPPGAGAGTADAAPLGDATAEATGIRATRPPGLVPGTAITATYRADTPGVDGRRLWVVRGTLEADTAGFGTFVVPPPPSEAGPTHLHVALGAPGGWRGVGYAAWPLGADERVAVVPHRPACDADDDGHFACHGACCAAWPAALRPAILDCLDEPGAALRLAEAQAGGPLLADAKRRRADATHAFRPLESALDYFECDNGLDDACAGADVACERRRDADQDGVPLTLDCDDGNPDVRPDAPDPPGDGLDANCDGRDAAGTDRDLDGFTVEGHPADCDDGRSEAAPGHADAPCDGVDDDCDGLDPCAPTGLPRCRRRWFRAGDRRLRRRGSGACARASGAVRRRRRSGLRREGPRMCPGRPRWRWRVRPRGL